VPDKSGLVCDAQQAAPTDVVLSRLGDDEFAILLEGYATPSTILRFAEHIQAALSAPLVLGKHTVRCTTCVGSAFSTLHQAAADDVLRDAESALRRVRALGTGRSELFDPAMHNRAVHRLRLEADLRTALNRNEFRVLYQPMLRISPRELIGFEALLRWQHPQHGLIAPDEFLAAAEDTGLMALIDQRVIRKAYRQIYNWQPEIDVPLRIAVNLSARHFTSPKLIDGIRDCFRDSVFSEGKLQLEANALVAMRNPEHTVEMFTQMKRMGVVTAIDDFGNSDFSLASLRRFGCDLLKIDRALITNMQADRTSHDVVELILAMACKLNCEVIAEGVEKAAQLDDLGSMGCNSAQGYFFSSPLDPQAAQQYLRKARTVSALPS
jgi:EAL domain-containing protein (putative c-di-GMP-specific phosphodiesterase class I)